MGVLFLLGRLLFPCWRWWAGVRRGSGTSPAVCVYVCALFVSMSLSHVLSFPSPCALENARLGTARENYSSSMKRISSCGCLSVCSVATATDMEAQKKK